VKAALAKCQSLMVKETVAVRIIKKDTDFIQDIEKEVFMLKMISVLNPDHTNVVKFVEHFEHMGQTCLVYEMLDTCLYGVLQGHWKPLSLTEVQPIANLLMALGPEGVKLIDFGAAIPVFESPDRDGASVNPLQLDKRVPWLSSSLLRAPEIALGLPISEAIDVAKKSLYKECQL
ncbi:hypothetical protein L3Q82_025247, partial [Scortum barcoo]